MQTRNFVFKLALATRRPVLPAGAALARFLCRFLLGLALLGLVPSCFADPLHVTSWSMQSPTGTGGPTMNQPRIREAAAALSKLDPDVILLHQVRDWQMCAQLADALKPEVYNVLICSSFRSARTGPPRTHQVAILSKHKAYFSWSETWRSDSEADIPGGYAFAAIELQGARLGFFCVQMDEEIARALAGQRPPATLLQGASYQQWVQAIDTFKHWVTNRIEAGIIVSTMDTPPGLDASRLLEAAGFARKFLGAPLNEVFTPLDRDGQRSVVPDYFTARLMPNQETLTGVVLTYAPATCDIELLPSQPLDGSLVRASNLLPSAPKQPTAHPADAEAKPAGPRPARSEAMEFILAVFWRLGAILGGALTLFGLIWLLTRRKRRRALATAALAVKRATASPDYTVLVASQSVTGSVSDDSMAPAIPGSVIHLDAPGMAHTQTAAWPPPTPAEQPAEAASDELRDGLVPHLREWLKQKLVSKLIADRAKLMADQHAATLKAMAVDERLARIEAQIQQQNQIYEHRITELNRELLAAREENRELIRVRINQVKAEMQAARARMMAQAQADSWDER